MSGLPKFSSRGSIWIPLVLLILTAGSFAITGGINGFKGFKSTPTSQTVNNAQPNFSPDPERKNLQLNTFTFVTPTPIPPSIPPQPQCPPEDAANAVTFGFCCKHYGLPAPGEPCCDNSGGTHADGACDYKPVIYLYPEKSEMVSVKLSVPGKITVSIPNYIDGWNNILANPNGILIYKGKMYNELFYETLQEKPTQSGNGIVVKRENLENELTNITTKLGLNSIEQKEFLDFWVEKLNGINKPYFLVSVFLGSEKDRIDHVDINPKPDTFINFIMYYKGLSEPIKIAPLNLPETPIRVGFTAVEWGGIID